MSNENLSPAVKGNHPRLGVNANTTHKMKIKKSLSTPSRAGLVADFHLTHTELVAAISELHYEHDPQQLEAFRKTDTFIRELMQSYQGTGELPDWAKFVSPSMKQYFRIHLLCTKPDAKAVTIRLDQASATAALAAPRGPANYLAEVIKRSLAKLGVESDLALNLEFNHTATTENHPLHIHGAFCIPDELMGDVSAALRDALAQGYRQRYNNLAVLIEKPKSARMWATYCIKEYGMAAASLKIEGGLHSRPDYATRRLTQQAKIFYSDVGAWLAS